MLSTEFTWIKTRTKHCHECGEMFTETLILKPDADDWMVMNLGLTIDFREKHKDHTIRVSDEHTARERKGRH